jgi:NAD-dependent dihydropyrimidine dehydrogenase PreA subunit
MSVVVTLAACTGCGLCIATCPTRALRPAPHGPLLEGERCTDCAACIEVCPTGAIAGSWETGRWT